MSSDYLGDIEKLQALREKGAVTEEEFGEAKAKLLAGMSRSSRVTVVAKVDRGELRNQGLFFHNYPVWLMVVLSVVTLGAYTEFWLNHWHGLMPKRRGDDPSTAKAIWFLFIPFFNFYWIFESLLRLCTRLDEELADAGLPDRVPKELVRWFCILSLIPYVSLVTNSVLGAIATGRMQSLVNQLARFDWETAQAGR